LNNANTAFLYGTLNENSVTDMGTGNGITTNRYFDIRRCNLALEGIDTSKTLLDGTKNQLKAQFYFLRAFTYFKLVTLYGGVPLVLKAQEITNEGIVATPRSKTSECIAAIVKDLDSAAAFLPASWPTNSADYGKITKAAAKAMKGKVLLYWASPQFNPTNIVSRWEDAYAANLEAYLQCLLDGRTLLPSYANIFSTEDHQEILLVRKYTTTRDFGTNQEQVTRPSSETTTKSGGGSNQPTWNLVQAYTMSNGLPITNVASGYNSTLFWQNRDPRFEASIAYNGGSWPLSGNATRKQWTHTGVTDEVASTIVTGFYCKRLCNPSIIAAQALYNSNTGGGSGMDWIEMRVAEVILNIAECANETNRLTEAKNMVRLIRQRAGITTSGTLDYGMEIASNIPTMRSLILNERQVEFAMEGKRYFDLRRTRNLNLISARQSYKLAAKLPYVAGNPPNPPVVGRIYLDAPNAFGIRPRDTATLNNIAVFTTIYTPTIASIEGSNVINIPNNYYFYALPNFFSQNTFVIEQTQGWINGTFDPLQ
jgi:starch-binding outer membrane protein, SusD/RagB family